MSTGHLSRTSGPPDLEEAERRYRQGRPLTEVAEALGVDPGAFLVTLESPDLDHLDAAGDRFLEDSDVMDLLRYLTIGGADEEGMAQPGTLPKRCPPDPGST